MNAVAKGVSLGIYEDKKQRGMEAVKGGSQSYIEFMGRRYVHLSRPVYLAHTGLTLCYYGAECVFSTIIHYIHCLILSRPLYQTQTKQWRALSNGSPVKPSTAFSYISRAFRQTTPHVIGALKLLADSFPSQEINALAWSLYAEFRPAVDQWGKRSEVKCSTILDLRKKNAEPPQYVTSTEGIVKHEEQSHEPQNEEDLPPDRKKMKGLSLEEYEAALDQDFAYDDIDLNFDETLTKPVS